MIPPDPDEPQNEGELIRMTYRMVKDLRECKEDHETRIRTLENSFWKVIGLASIISFIAGWFGSKFPGGGN